MNAHPMMPATTHDEAAEQLFVRDLKVYLTQQIEPLHQRLAVALDPGPADPEQVASVYASLHEHDSFRAWASVRRTSQEIMWDAVSRSVERQAATLNERSAAVDAGGTVTLDPAFVPPAYITVGDIHLMPGGYQLDLDDDVSQGAVMDRGGAVYMLGRNGGLMNDGRGHTLVSHLFACYPGFQPDRILEMGCGIGASTVPIARYFPEAEIQAIDVGASMLRYAHARAAHLGARIHFVQDDAEQTQYEDGSFDLVFSCVILHETSETAIARIMAESFRLLRPGGVVAHLEVPNRYETLDLWGRIRGEVEADYNNEPNWKHAISADYEALLRDAGFPKPLIGYQLSSFAAKPGAATPEAGGFSDKSSGTFRSWFVASARKPV